MKLLKNTYKEKEYSFLCLENMEDAKCYAELNALVKSRQAVGFWIAFKSQDFRQSPIDFIAHEEPSGNGIARVLSMKMHYSQEPTSLVKYCTDADTLIYDMNVTIFKYINDGWLVRINSVGGYCPIKDLDEYEKVIYINEQEMYNFLLHKDINFKFEISKSTIVIENDNYIPDELITKFCNKTKVNKDDIQIFTSFKHRTILFKENDFIKFFNDGIISGMQNLVFETTSQDQSQIDKIKKVFEYLMNKHPDKTINIYAKVYDSDKHLFETKSKNIKINFI